MYMHTLYPSALHIPFSWQELMQYQWEPRPEGIEHRIERPQGVDQIPPGVRWWILHSHTYHDQGGTWQPVYGDRAVTAWWWARVDPGYTFPMHVDLGHEQSTRVWCPWQDYEPGHVFVLNGHCVESYRAGDCVEFSGTDAHAAANIHTELPKISLQLVLE
jgi:hypothetical protein